MRVRWLRVLRDIIIVTIFVFVGGFIVGFATQGLFTKESMLVATLFLGTLGFCLCGCLTTENRWKHLFIVASGVWLVNMLWELLPKQFSMLAWVLSIFIIFIPMVIGGALSSILVKAPKQKEKTDEQK
ncbi:unnamed protein product [marine sediment metagenome]|uniref:Major facilitator superfamily (MFS) profile domain-containing protein n=1 Tax=marine sediment metagenome TaxID=412755 RepID=X0SYY9_9ZZZZ